MSLLSRGYAMLGRNRYPEALDLYEQAHDLYAQMHGDDSTFMVELCRMEIDGVLEDAAVFDLDLASDIPASDPGSEMGFMNAMNKRNRARFLHAADASDFALQQLEQSLAVSQLDAGFRAHTLMTRARILMDLNRLVAAEADLNEALELLDSDGLSESPGEAPIRGLLAELCLRSGRSDEAGLHVARLEELRSPFIGDSPPWEALEVLREQLPSTR